MTQRQTKIEIRITNERKEDWKAYVDESYDVDSLSDLVRLAVAKERHGSNTSTSEVSVDPEFIDTFDEQFDEVSKRVATVKEQLEFLHAEIGRPDDLDQLVSDLTSQLIEVPDEETFRALEVTESDAPDIQARIDGTPRHLAKLLGVSRQHIQRALTRAHEQYPDVMYVRDIYGRRRYYRRNPDIDGLDSEAIDASSTPDILTATELPKENRPEI